MLVVGCGSIGERHLHNLFSLGLSNVLVCEIDESRHGAIRSRYHVSVYRSLSDAIAAGPCLALVCVPNHLHLPVALELAQAGIHLFIEKPLSNHLEGVADLVSLIEKNKLVCLVGCNMRFHPAISQIKKWIEGGSLGSVLSIRAHYGHYLPNWRPKQDYRLIYSARASEGGGIILDAIHEIDYVRWLGGEVSEVFSCAQKASDLATDVEDTAEILLQFSKRAHASIHVDCLDRVKRRSCEVVGSKGTAIWRSTRKNPEEVVLEYHSNNQVRSVEQFEADPNRPYMAELQHLLDCVDGKTQPILGVRDAWADLAIALAARDSAVQHQPVGIEPVWRTAEAS